MGENTQGVVCRVGSIILQKQEIQTSDEQEPCKAPRSLQRGTGSPAMCGMGVWAKLIEILKNKVTAGSRTLRTYKQLILGYNYY